MPCNRRCAFLSTIRAIRFGAGLGWLWPDLLLLCPLAALISVGLPAPAGSGVLQNQQPQADLGAAAAFSTGTLIADQQAITWLLTEG
jgi:hypothetical protein